MAKHMIYITQEPQVITLTYEARVGIRYILSDYTMFSKQCVMIGKLFDSSYRHDAIGNLLCNEAIAQGGRAIDVKRIYRSNERGKTKIGKVSKRQLKLF